MTVKNMKKGIGAVAGLAMVAALFAAAPAAYAADGDNTAADGYVAEVIRKDTGNKIENGDFTTLQDAVSAAWGGNSTVRLLKNVEVN